QFACDGRDDDGGLLATGDQPAITSAESSLSLPCDIAHVLGQTDQDLSLVSGDASRILIAPCGFDEHAAGFPVAGLGDAATPDRVSAGVFGRNQTEICHQLTW